MSAAVRSAVVTMAAVVLTLGVALALDPGPGPAVFAMLLAISLSRSQLERDLRGRLEAGIAMPLVSLIGLGVGALLTSAPVVGAAIFSAVLAFPSCSDASARSCGVWGADRPAVHDTPHRTSVRPRARPALERRLALVIGVVAWGAVTVLQLIAIRLGALPRQPAGGSGSGASHTWGRMRPDATIRLTVQMLVTVGAAFAVGFVFFADRWSWVVITALTVTLGNMGGWMWRTRPCSAGWARVSVPSSLWVRSSCRYSRSGWR